MYILVIGQTDRIYPISGVVALLGSDVNPCPCPYGLLKDQIEVLALVLASLVLVLVLVGLVLVLAGPVLDKSYSLIYHAKRILLY